MKHWRAVVACLLPLVLALLCLAAFFVRPVAIKTSLYDLVGRAGETFPAALRDRASGLVPVVVSAPTHEAAKAAADDLVSRLLAEDFRSVKYRLAEIDFAAELDAYLADRAGVVSAADRILLTTKEGRAALAERHLVRLYSDLSPTLFPVEEDAFGLTESFVRSLMTNTQGWTPKDGVLTVEKEGAHHVLIVLDLRPELAADTDGLIDFHARLRTLGEAVETTHDEVRIALSGVPIHTATTAGACKREIAGLSIVSLLFIATLALVVFRSIRWLGFIALTLTISALAGGFALIACFNAVHLMTLVFGTTLLGLVIDYSFHWLLQEPGTRARLVKGLGLSWLTTEVSLLPLFFSSLPVLRQSATFLGAGLAAALLTVLVLYPRHVAVAEKTLVNASRRVPFWRILFVIAVVLACFGLLRVTVATPPQALYRPVPELASAERFMAEVSGASKADRGFLVMDRAAVYEDVLLLYDEHGADHAEALGYDAPFAAPAAPAAETPEYVLPLEDPPEGPLPPGVRFCQPTRLLAEVLTVWTAETRLCLAWSLALMLVILALFCRWRAVLILLPSVTGLAVVAGLLGWLGEPINLFHLLAAFLLVGMAIDYAVFLQGGGKSAWRPATCSLVTSLVGFGLLICVSFPVVRAFGFTLGVGLPTAFLCALATAPRAGSTKSPAEPSAEHAASPLGLEILWWVYRLFGLRFLHVLASLVGTVVWLSSRTVRRATPRLAKMRYFTRSLADKLVVMAEGRRLPRVTTDGSADAAAFVEDVQSGKGVFVLSSHVGTIEVLAALGECRPVFHAWMEFDRTGVFNRFYLHHAQRQQVVIHPISEFGPQTVFVAGDALDAGDCLLMAADRTFGRVRREQVGERTFELAEGAFRFAAALDHPVYFVACLADGPCSYRAVIRRLKGSAKDLAAAYARSLAEIGDANPDQWFVWET